ncbi:MAG: hypothetical protein J6X68_04245 [Lachnospiraceae bacterium]|nr:hypothetical protein [Lachnospiraceae bacterium]
MILSELEQIFNFVGGRLQAYLQELNTIMFIGITVTWIITVQRRVTDRKLRRYLVFGGTAIIALFIMRLIRWILFSRIFVVDRYFWYAYYIPTTILPFLSLLLALNVGREAEIRSKKTEKTLIAIWICLIVMILTNDLHNFVFKIGGYYDGTLNYKYNYGYYVVIAWCVLLTAVSFVTLIIRSRTSVSKELALIPAYISMFFVTFLLIYIIRGGKSPTILGRKLYNFQEIYALVYIGLWEASLRIGLIPSNSDYDDIFGLSTINAAIAGMEGKIKYRSDLAEEITEDEIARAENGEEVFLDENRVIRVQSIPVGKVAWVEDHTTINELNAGLKDALDRISEENNLLEMENEIKGQKASIEVRNKLYDKISFRTQWQLKKIEEILEKVELSGEDPDEAIKLCSVFGAYAKRQANLSIMAEHFKYLKLEELRYAIRESLENIRLLGVDANVSGIKADTEFEGELLIFAYEFFETTIEAALPDVETISCILLGEDGLRLEILMDTPFEIPDYSNFNTESHGLKVEVLHEDEGVYVRLFSLKESEVNVCS